jgi:DNA-directed RNA polymerase subunit M/transcription elongation factor TFIIS
LEKIANRRGPDGVATAPRIVLPAGSIAKNLSVASTAGKNVAGSAASKNAAGSAASRNVAGSAANRNTVVSAANRNAVGSAASSKAAAAVASDVIFINEIKEYTAKLVSAVVTSSGAYAHDNLTRDHCPECGKYLLAVNSKKGEMLVCQDRECGYRKSIAVVSNARCPNCHKKLTLRGDGDSRSFLCACGHRERLVDFEARRESTVGRREVERFMEGQAHADRSGGELNSALSEQLKALMGSEITNREGSNASTRPSPEDKKRRR